MIDHQKQNLPIRAIGSYLLVKGWVYALLIAGLLMFYIVMTQYNLPSLVAFALLPLVAVGLILLLKYSKEGFYVLFAIQFLLIIASSFVDIKLGVATLILCLFISSLLVIRAFYERLNWQESLNGMLICYLVLGLYYIAEIANPNNVQEAWNISITHYLVYPILCAILVPFTIRNVKGIQWLLLLWSLFILYAAIKGYWQKNQGFNEKELYFLYVLGAAKTHIIWSGIRYFSCFTDAANFGVHMAMAITAFGISLFYTKSIALKIYFAVVVIAAIYGMGISGTRAAIAIPIGGLGLFILLSRSRKAGIVGLVTLLALFCFFRFTTIGDSNQYVRKMRSAFNPSTDASYQLRVENRERMKTLMVHKPFGYGVGLSKGERFYPKERMPYPPDSWLVSVWVETGIVGLILYLAIHGVLFAWCSWILMFKVMNNRLRGLLSAWLCMNAGFFVAAYANDVMQYPNSIVIYTGFALSFAGPYIDKQLRKEKEIGLLGETQERGAAIGKPEEVKQ